MAMKVVLTAVVMLVWAVFPAAAEDAHEIKVYSAREAGGSVDLDGRLTEACWHNATMASGFTLYDQPIKVAPQTFVQMTYDPEHLYFGITCDETQMTELQQVAQARDAHAIFSGETIEIFVEPFHNHHEYYQFGVNSAASIYDSRGTDPVWNAAVQAGTHLDGDGWSLEVAIPWADLGLLPAPGAVIGINVCRDRRIGARQWSNWSQTEGGFHDPAHFGHLVLSPDDETLGGLGPEFRRGDRRGPIVIYTPEGFSETTYRGLAVAAVAEARKMLDDLGAARQVEPSAAAKRELGVLLEQYRAKLAPFAEAAHSEEGLDARAWTHTEMGARELTTELADVVWEARLRALLSEI